MEFGDCEEQNDEKILGGKKKKARWEFLPRSCVNKYYFKGTLALHSIC